jgi:hypothetical protein
MTFLVKIYGLSSKYIAKNLNLFKPKVLTRNYIICSLWGDFNTLLLYLYSCSHHPRDSHMIGLNISEITIYIKLHS